MSRHVSFAVIDIKLDYGNVEIDFDSEFGRRKKGNGNLRLSRYGYKAKKAGESLLFQKCGETDLFDRFERFVHIDFYDLTPKEKGYEEGKEQG